MKAHVQQIAQINFQGVIVARHAKAGNAHVTHQGGSATLTYVEAVELTSHLFLLETRVVHVVIHR